MQCVHALISTLLIDFGPTITDNFNEFDGKTFEKSTENCSVDIIEVSNHQLKSSHLTITSPHLWGAHTPSIPQPRAERAP